MNPSAAAPDDLLEIGRQLGWDHAHYGLDLRNCEDLPGVREGYAAARASRGIGHARFDRFVRKLLQLRANALRRGKVADASLTVENLKLMDTPVCPVTLVPLTYGARLDTDWSVDRLYNDGAYADGNLVILSTRANRAKGARGFEAVLALARGSASVDGLTPREWLRLASLMFGVCAAAEPHLRRHLPLPLATRISNRLLRHLYHLLQHCLLRAFASTPERNQVDRSLRRLNPHDTGRFELVMRWLGEELKRSTYAYDALVNDRLQRLLWAWFIALGPARWETLRTSLVDMTGGDNLSPATVAGWSTATRGRIR